jgi:hypothetical protein
MFLKTRFEKQKEKLSPIYILTVKQNLVGVSIAADEDTLHNLTSPSCNKLGQIVVVIFNLRRKLLPIKIILVTQL